MNWKNLSSIQGLDELVAQSHEQPCLLFKHSTRCSISAMAKHRLERDWLASTPSLQPFYLDLIAFRQISNEVESRFGIRHESPQALLIQNGRCVYDASHLDIHLDEIVSISSTAN